MIRHLKNSIILIAVLFLGGCESPVYPQAKPVPAINFDHLNPYLIKGGRVKITQSFMPDAQTQKISQEFGFSPANLLGRYAEKRFETVRDPVTMIFDIQKARLTKSTEQTDPLDFMTGLTQDVYNLEVLIAMHPVVNAVKQAPYTIYYEQKLIVSENVSLSAREYRQFELMEDMVSDIDQSVTQIVTQKINN